MCDFERAAQAQLLPVAPVPPLGDSVDQSLVAKIGRAKVDPNHGSLIKPAMPSPVIAGLASTRHNSYGSLTGWGFCSQTN
jgi:hypothetical protein